MARRAGVSIATVSVVLRGLDTIAVGEATRTRVREAARALRYRHNALAAGLRTGRTDVVAVLVERLAMPQLAAKVAAAETLLRERGMRTVLWHTAATPEVEVRALKDILSQMASGLLVTYPVRAAAREALRDLQAAGIPVAMLEPVDGVDAHVVTVDRRLALRLATEHLARLGHRRIGLVGPPDFIDPAQGYGLGYGEGLRVHGLAVRPEWIYGLPRGELFAAGHAIGLRVLAAATPPAALVCADDEVAIGIMRAVREAGWSVPGDLAIVGFDDLPVAAFAPVPLTTVRHPTREAGQRAARLLLADVEAGTAGATQRIVLEPELVVRRSCGSGSRGVHSEGSGPTAPGPRAGCGAGAGQVPPKRGDGGEG